MIFDRLALYGVGGALIVALGLAGSVKLGEMARTRERNVAIAERDWSDDKADLVCAQGRSSFRIYDRHTGKPRPRKEWGAECQGVVLTLQQRVDGEQARISEALLADRAERDAKDRTDRAAARRNATQQSQSQRELEAAYAAVQDGNYGPQWFHALGAAFGLRSAAQAGPAPDSGPAGGGAEGPAPG